MKLRYLLSLITLFIPSISFASGEAKLVDFTDTTVALIVLIIFISAYVLVIA